MQRFDARYWAVCALCAGMLSAGMLSVQPVFAQEEGAYPEVDYPALPAHAVSAQGFVPEEWALEYLKTGDLNKDTRDDLVFVLKMRREANIVKNEGLGMPEFDTNPRILAVAFADGEGYRLVLQNHTLIPRPDSPVMDDYLQDADALAVRRGAFTVSLLSWASAGSWSTGTTTYTFRHQDDCFRLIGYDNDYLHRGSGETLKTSINFVAGKAEFERGSIEDDGAGEKRQVKVTGREPLCLQEIGNGFEYDPGVRSPFDQ